MEPDQRKAAQRRADRIEGFRAELEELAAEGGLVLSDDQRTGLEAHHRRLLAEFQHRWGIDTTESTRRASWGIRVTALLAAAALVAAVVLFLHRIWIHLPLALQAALLAGAPLLVLGGADWTARRRMDPYFTALLGLAAGVVFVLELNALGAMLNLAPSPHALLAWALFAGFVAHAYGLRLILALGLVLGCAYSGALMLVLGGHHWEAFLEHARTMVPAAALVYAVPAVAYRPDPRGFAAVFRSCGAGVGLAALLIESLGENPCCGLVSGNRAEAFYQLAGIAISAAVVLHGLRLGQAGLVNLGSVAFVAFLYARLHAWWWDWMPKYLFFLLIGMCAVVLLFAFHRLRTRLAERGPG